MQTLPATISLGAVVSLLLFPWTSTTLAFTSTSSSIRRPNARYQTLEQTSKKDSNGAYYSLSPPKEEEEQRQQRQHYSYAAVSRRTAFLKVATGLLWVAPFAPGAAVAAPAPLRQPLDELLYRIVRVQEATQQEARLIKTGKFKDTQRANIKLAVRFMIENYRLNDAFVAASTYLEQAPSGNRRLEASQVGQSAVQNLYTILEYFDSADVENLKVGQSSLSGKEEIVIKGLEATKRSIDDFLAFFPKSEVDRVLARVAEENALNIKEFDPSLGKLINISPL